MKYGSLINHLYSMEVVGEPKPVKGMGATVLMWTDRSPCTIVEVQPRTLGPYTIIITTRGDRVTADRIESDADGTLSHWGKRRTDGIWQSLERTERGYRKRGGGGLRIGERDYYRDPEF
jgi:hypothetical protein